MHHVNLIAIDVIATKQRPVDAAGVAAAAVAAVQHPAAKRARSSPETRRGQLPGRLLPRLGSTSGARGSAESADEQRLPKVIERVQLIISSYNS